MIACGCIGQLFFIYVFIKEWKNESVETIDLFLYLMFGGLAAAFLSPALIPLILLSPFYLIVKLFRMVN